MTIALDLTKRHWTKVRGPITAVGTWFNNGERWRQCIALFRTDDEGSDELVPCVIPIDRAWVWSEDIGDGRQSARMTVAFAQAMRLTIDKRTLITLTSMIHDLLGDLLTIPPYQAAPGEVIAEVVVTNRDTGKSHEVVLRDV